MIIAVWAVKLHHGSRSQPLRLTPLFLERRQKCVSNQTPIDRALRGSSSLLSRLCPSPSPPLHADFWQTLKM